MAALAAGYLYPSLGAEAYRNDGPRIVTFAIFLLTGLQLKLGDARAAAISWFSALYATASSLLLAPLAALPVLALPPAQLAPPLAIGLAVMLCVPTTLSTHVLLTASAGGNAALSLDDKTIEALDFVIRRGVEK